MIMPPAHGTGMSGAGQVPATPEIELPLGEYIAGAQERVNLGIERCLEDVGPDFREMYEHALAEDKPKRRRPVLAYMTGDTLEIPREDIDELALAVELIHSASLVMDDLPAQDNGVLRRGKEALHIRFGEDQAQDTIIAMIADAAEILANVDVEHNLRGTLVPYIMRSIGRRGMSLGQSRDTSSAKKPAGEMTEKKLDRISWLKTGTAIEMSTVGAAMLGSSLDVGAVIPPLRDYSYHYGIAYQAKDDIEDATKTAEETGKTADIDARNNKPTYFSMLGEAVAREKTSRHAEAALAALDGLPERYNPGKLREIIGPLIER